MQRGESLPSALPRRADNAVPGANQPEPQSSADATRRAGQEHKLFLQRSFLFDSVCKVRRLDRSFSNPARVALKRFFPHVLLSRRDVGVSDGADCEREVTLPHHSHNSLVPERTERVMELAEQLQTSTHTAADNPGRGV